MKVITLEEYGEKEFLSELKRIKEMNYAGDQRNIDWFDRIPEIYKTRFPNWWFLMDRNDKLVMFATVQEFYQGCWRLLTRSYILPEYRRPILPDRDTMKSPSMYIIQEQMNYLQNVDLSLFGNEVNTYFISMQDLKRRKSLDRYRKKLGPNWKLLPTMMQTCKECDDLNCWQNIIYTGEVPRNNTMSLEEWREKFEG